MTNLSESCATCRFWRREDGDSGICRRYKPQIMSTVWTGQPAQAQGPLTNPGAQALVAYQLQQTGAAFPTMSGKEGWCGEHATSPHEVN